MGLTARVKYLPDGSGELAVIGAAVLIVFVGLVVAAVLSDHRRRRRHP